MWRLINPVQHYGWGSTDDIPGVLGVAPDGLPQAEMWFGAHPSAPSLAIEVVSTIAPGRSVAAVPVVPLDEVVAGRPGDVLGAASAARFGPRLPFLTKLLSAARPLSLQVHPDAAQASARHAREVSDDVAAEDRNYPDAHHKPELLVALAPTRALAGFRHPDQAADHVDGLGVDGVSAVVELLRGPQSPSARVRAAFTAVLGLPPEVIGEVTQVLAAQVDDGPYGISRTLAGCYAQDPGVVASLLLNSVLLDPGCGLYVGAGDVHCYVSGFGVEVMAASDNVLRAGLTSKRVDVPEMLSLVDFEPAAPHVVRPEVAWSEAGLTGHRYATPAPDFELWVVDVRAATPTRLPGPGGPRTVVCLDGVATVTGASGSCGVSTGEAVLLGDADGDLRLSGLGRLAVVHVAAATPAQTLTAAATALPAAPASAGAQSPTHEGARA